MAEKIKLDQGELPPVCPHCKTTLTKMVWHKVKGGPMGINYIVAISCPHCSRVLGVVGS